MTESAYWLDFTEADVRRELAVAWHPEIEGREMYWGCAPTPRIITVKDDGRGNDGKDRDDITVKGKLPGKVEEKVEVSTCSLFDRLQSLLVEVGSEDDADDGSRNDDTDDDDDLWELSGSTRSHKEDDDDVLDVSELSLDQRTYIHLRAIQLIDQPLLPSSHPAVVEEEIAPPPSSNNTTRNRDSRKRSRIIYTTNGNRTEHDMDLQIRRRQIELSELHRQNNERAAFIQDKARNFLSPSNKAKNQSILDLHNNLIQKHGQLAKRQRRVNKTKVEKRTDEWVPW